MTGVEILAMEEIVSAAEFNWTMFWIIVGIFVGIMFLIGAAASVASHRSDELFMCVLFGALIGPLFGMLVGAGTSTPTEYTTQYKVTISDEVSMNDFMERYEIINQEGKIYTVQERVGEQK